MSFFMVGISLVVFFFFFVGAGRVGWLYLLFAFLSFRFVEM